MLSIRDLVFASGDELRCASGGDILAGQDPKAPSWMQISRDQSSLDRGRCFVLADTSSPSARQMAYNLSLIGYDVEVCDDHDTMMGVFRGDASDRNWTFLVVDLDFVTHTIDLDEIVGDLLELRRLAKELNVIIVSNDLGRSDNGLSRLSIADVSIKAPVSMGALLRGVWDARVNNKVWQDRLREETEVAISPP
jgi:hypothetical protein